MTSLLHIGCDESDDDTSAATVAEICDEVRLCDGE